MFGVFKHLKDYKNVIVLIIALVFIQSIMELFLPTIMSGVIDDGIVKKDMNRIIVQSLKMIGVIVVSIISSLTSLYLASKVAVRFSQDIRRKIFVKVQSFSSREFNKFGVASLINRTTNDITQIQILTLMLLRMMIFGPLMAIGGLIIAIYSDVKLATVLIVSVPTLLVIVSFIGIRTMRIFSLMQKKLDRVNLIFRENLTGIRVIRAFNKQKYEEKRFDNANKDLTKFTANAYKIFARLMPVMMLIFYLNSVAIIWFGGHRVGGGTLLVGDLIAFIQYSNQIMIALMTFFMLFGIIPKAVSSAKRIGEVLETDFSISDLDEPTILNNDSKVSLKFDNVSFAYNETGEYDIEDIDFECVAGETVAIIGGTGSGKSSVLNLIMRFYDVSKGSILINGIDIREISQKELREQVGYIPQKAVLFSGTVRSNLCYGKENATEEEMINALKISQSYDFVYSLDKNLDAPISQGGANLSGGQKQRLSIARALIRNPKIYLFDDSFSALDFKTDVKLRTALKENVKDSIVIIVGQRITSIMNSDKIIVLDNGKIVGIGNHRELLDNCKVYQEIAKSQLSEEELS